VAFATVGVGWLAFRWRAGLRSGPGRCCPNRVTSSPPHIRTFTRPCGRPVTYPGATPARVAEFSVAGKYEDLTRAVSALDGALDLARPGATRILVIVSDGRYKCTRHACCPAFRMPARVRDEPAGQLERAWAALVEPWWPRIRDVLDADITYRARRLADSGLAAALNQGILGGPHAPVHASRQPGDRPGRRRTRPHSQRVRLAPPGRHLRPARGHLPGPRHRRDLGPRPRSPQDLARLIGRARAILLTALSEPASTTGLAARAGLPVSSVSEHLAILRPNQLVATTRTGRYLIHQRTPLGETLAG
jgi:Bacterial regulatory protein, arsR family